MLIGCLFFGSLGPVISVAWFRFSGFCPVVSQLPLSSPVPPYIDDTDLDSNPTVIQGKHHILLCPANGIPYPDVKWFRGLRPIRDDVRMHVLLGGRQLRISASQRGDTGRYTCVATNIAGEARKHFDLQVLGTWSRGAHNRPTLTLTH